MEGVDRRAVVLDPAHPVVHADPQEVGHPPSPSHRRPTLEDAERAAAGPEGLDDFVYLYLGEGLGCAVVADGEVRRGWGGLAGEIAHVLTRGPGGRAVAFTDVFATRGCGTRTPRRWTWTACCPPWTPTATVRTGLWPPWPRRSAAWSRPSSR
ncbi:ROK family protein [Geodermatophilus sp. SYSU D00710]